MKRAGVFCFLSVFLLCVGNARAWDQEQLEIFDLVEEINENFYTVLKVNQSATAPQVRSAFRQLSVVTHPDKNKAEDATEQFRRLVSVYEVLKDASKRAKYDQVLADGLPDWKSAVYYYRHYRKMGLMEMSILLFVILTIGQYIVSWAVYAEKKYTAESIFGSKLRKLQKKNKSSVNIDDILNQIPTPSVTDTLPFLIVRGVWYAPRAVKNIFADISEQKERVREEKRREVEEAEHQRQLEEEFVREKEARKEGMRRRKPAFAAQEKTDEELKGYSKLNMELTKGSAVKAVESKEPAQGGGFWTDEDIAELVRLVKKYPNGTISRWEIIANQMNRAVTEVTFMAARMKESVYRQQDSVAEVIVKEATKKLKKAPAAQVDEKANDAKWSQEHQKLLEIAIVKYPKTIAGDRWQKIANTVPGKTKDECLARYKYLVQKVKDQKQKETAAESQGNDGEKERPTEDTQPAKAETGNDAAVQANQETSGVCVIDDEPEEAPKKSGGKPRNKRKERKKRMDFSSDEDANEE